METRKILIANTKTQQRYTIESAATTLGELQDHSHRNISSHLFRRQL